jgi:arylsulfatase A-like enzyme
MQRAFTALRCSLGILLLGAVLGAGAGVVRGVQVVAQNDYQAQGLARLARWTLVQSAGHGMRQGLLVALLVLVCLIVLWPIARLFLGDWRRALQGAALAIPVIGLWLPAAWYANRFFLPGALTVASVLGNLALAAIAVALWYALLRIVERSPLAPQLAKPIQWARPLPLLAMFLAVVVVQSTQVLARAEAPQAPARVLLIVIDALRPDRLGAYGYERDTSPNLDQFTRESWLYRNAVSVAPWTKPSIASLLTGLYPRSHGVADATWNRSEGEGDGPKVAVLSRRLLTFPEILADAGYRTAAFGANHHLVARLGFDQGFEAHEMSLIDSGALQSLARRLGLGFAKHLSTVDSGHLGAAHRINEYLLDWLPKDDEPFFAYLHHINVHWPYRAPAPYAGRFGPRRSGVDFNSPRFYAQFGPEREQHDAPTAIDAAVLKDMSDAYDEGITFVDAEIGALFAELKRRGLYDKTLIIVTADHGEQFLEHGEVGHGTSLHDVLLRIPLMIKFPCPGPYCGARTVEDQVQLVDLMPTILDFVHLNSPPDLAGDSLIEPPHERVLFAEKGDQVALRTPHHKLIYNLDGSEAELYALQSDPGERSNLASAEPELLETLRDRLFQWIEETERNPAPGEEIAADSEMLAKLKALGYVK